MSIERNAVKIGMIETPRLSDELKEAAAVQDVLLQHDAPLCKVLECKGLSIPAHYLGGDYYGFVYEEEKQKYWVFAGDVMGKGIPAFAKMAMLRTAIRTLTPQCETPSELLGKVNKTLHEDLKLLKSFATLFCGMYDLSTHTFTYASAGHPSAILKRTSLPSELLTAKGIAIGFLPERIYAEHEVSLEPGDYIVVYTDGILEAMNHNREQFGRDKVIELINGHNSWADLIPSIAETVLEYTDNEQNDDITMVTLKRIL
ncbi:PP2C family protein-serine/threonine phosphatase [Falsibacillus pallidus]|uniref:Serine phosphatase RsbU (Regulator of sigma subunit) n=1 Tax=Falsibacillus pallidus TaxID=493781 RepID=A0A370GC62_9BACI|nr:PP2C family protein-serine/threonine phosphatase [Falsibacillus pallidus]RDI40044.1 serine phosphatase RsbU (regulator of sigma subunit) [Falsibacillus pallidus]